MQIPRRRVLWNTLIRLFLAGIGFTVAVWTAARLQPLPSHWDAASPATPDPTVMRIVDREGHPVAVMRGVDHPFLPVALDRIDRLLVDASLAAEDQRFFSHPGIDPAAIARAAWQNLRGGRLVSGGSTLTQQLVTLMERSTPSNGRKAESTDALGASPRHGVSANDEWILRSGWRRKLRTAWLALALEMRWSKEQILEAYLNHAHYGADLRGVRTACLAYFGHEPDAVTLEEAALLAALPQSPIRLDPRRRPDAALTARNRVLLRMRIDPDAREQAQARSLGLSAAWPIPGASIAPHWVAHLAHLPAEICDVRIPLDGALQSECRSALQEVLQDLEKLGADAGGVTAIHNQTGEVRAWVGSADWSHPGHGQVDGTRALRQPGSALKPFAYALAFERGMHPSSILPDLPLSHPGDGGVFRPRNYSGVYRGPVRARMALANSWNAPAVDLLANLGTGELLSLFHSLGLESLGRSADEYGLGLVLGVGEVTLAELTNAYACLARGGIYYPGIEILEARDAAGRCVLKPGPISTQGAASTHAPATASPPVLDGDIPEKLSPRRVLDPEACFLVSSILSDEEARAPAFGQGDLLSLPYPAAIKTGTSSDWRDNWAFGFTQDWTVGVWVGTASGGSMNQISGTVGALRVLRRVLDYLYIDHASNALNEDKTKTSPGRFSAPPNMERRLICALSGMPAGRQCPDQVLEWFHVEDQEGDLCDWHLIVKIDSATGLLARSCTPVDRVREVLFVRSGEAGPCGSPPGLFDTWLRDEGRPLPPAAATPCICMQEGCGVISDELYAGGSDAGAYCRIWNPVEGSIYIIDPTLPRTQQALALEGTSVGEELVWYINGEEYARASSVDRVFWHLQPGRHEILLRSSGSGGEAFSDAVWISVEEGE